MQARKLSIGEVSLSSSSSPQVLKVLLDVPSQCFALLLADYSCLLFSSPLSGKSFSSPPFIIPPQCSDVCFLRLRERNRSKSNTTSASSSSSGKFSVRSESRNASNAVKTRTSVEEKVCEETQLPNGLKTKIFEEEKKLSDQRKHLEEEKKKVYEDKKLVDEKKKVCEERRSPFEEEKKFFEENKKVFQERKLSEEEKKKYLDANDRYGSMSIGRNTDFKTNELMFIVAKPALGGSGTDLVGWKCNGFQFTQTSLSLEDHRRGNPRSRSSIFSVAHFLDIPHGSFIGISASVNVIVLYSPTLAKVWILSAKLVGGQDHDLGRNSESIQYIDLGQNAEFVGKNQDFDRNNVRRQGQSQGRNTKYGDLMDEDSQNPLSQTGDHSSNGEFANLIAEYDQNIIVQNKDDTRRTKPVYFSAEDSLMNLYTAKQERMKGKLQENQFLQLVKCAVVDCHGPIYDLHISLQYLLVGQLGGVRIWPLRPLIKGKRTLKKKKTSEMCANGRSKEQQHDDKWGTTRQERSKILEFHEFGNKKGGLTSGSLHHDSTIVEDMGCQIIKLKNGLRVNFIKNEFVDSSLGAITYFPDRSNCERKVEGQTCNCNKNTSVQTMMNPNLEAVQTVENGSLLANAARTEQGDFEQEELNSQQRTSQSSVFSSSSSASSSATVFCSAAHRTVAQSLSISSHVETACAFRKDEFAVGVHEEVFVPFHHQSVSMKISEQVVSICSLSGKEYLILDSKGKLHLLVLRHYHRDVERMVPQQQTPQTPLDAVMQPLPCAMKIKTVAALPFASTAESPCASAMTFTSSRILWVSDGSHTIYALLIPPREMSKRVSEDNLLQLRSSPTVLVQTEGSMLAYFLSGA